MSDRLEYPTSELGDLKEGLESFQREKEQVRAIVGAIGGKPGTRARLISLLFFILVGAACVAAIAGGEEMRLLMVELTMVILSLKIIYLIHCQMRVRHFKFWMLSSLEWRLTEASKRTRELKEMSLTRNREASRDSPPRAARSLRSHLESQAKGGSGCGRNRLLAHTGRRLDPSRKKAQDG